MGNLSDQRPKSTAAEHFFLIFNPPRNSRCFWTLSQALATNRERFPGLSPHAIGHRQAIFTPDKPPMSRFVTHLEVHRWAVLAAKNRSLRHCRLGMIGHIRRSLERFRFRFAGLPLDSGRNRSCLSPTLPERAASAGGRFSDNCGDGSCDCPAVAKSSG